MRNEGEEDVVLRVYRLRHKRFTIIINYPKLRYWEEDRLKTHIKVQRV